MTTLLVAWVALPALLAALCLGCGLLVQALARQPLGGALLMGTGLCAMIVATQFTMIGGGVAKLATPLCVGMAVAGFGLALPRWRPRIDPFAAAAALGVLTILAAPIVASGQATFAGYIRLDDTATWMAITDRVMEHGRSLAGLAPSSYEATLAFNVGAGYPIGVFMPLGVAHQLLGTDVAWLIQPYMAFLATLLAVALWELAAPIASSRWLRGVAAFLAAQAALLVGYYLWGGVKEVAAATLVATLAGLAGRCIRTRFAPGTLVPLAIVSAALVEVLSGGGVFWLAPILVFTAVFAFRLLGARVAAGRAAGFLVLVLVLSIPVFLAAGLIPPTSSSLTDQSAQGNLLHPLEVTRLFGVWPSGDFRLDPADQPATIVLMAAVGLAAVLGAVRSWRAREWPLLLYVGGALATGLAIFLIGSPWLAGKALATASPALPLAAAVGGAGLRLAGRRVEGGVLLVALAGGVLWSNALAYRDVNLAPRDQLAELESIGHRIAGQGPTLMTEYQPYGVRHFLRDADPEGTSELRRRLVPLLSGHGLKKGHTADTDRFQLDGLSYYRTLVLRRSPAQSRPPSPYHLISEGDYYEVWQRPAGPPAGVIDHLGLGSIADPSGVPRCGDVERLAREAGPGGRLAAVPRTAPVAIPLSAMQHPDAWNSAAYTSALLPVTPGTLSTSVRIPAAGDYDVWLGGSVRPQVDLSVDGQAAGSVRHQLENAGEYVRLGSARLDPGVHRVTVTFHGADLHPGSGGRPSPIGPLVLSAQDAAQTRIVHVPVAAARSLCGHRWDWIEALG